MMRRGMLIWAGAALLAGGCAGGGTGSGVVLGPNPQSSVTPTGSPQASAAAPQAAPKATAAANHSLVDTKSWTQPTDIPLGEPAATLAALTAQSASLLILDPATVSAAAPVTAGATPPVKPLAVLHSDSHRRVLAVLDIAEIAKTNPLWKAAWADATGKLTPSAPAWLGQSASKSPGVYPVHYWDPQWQAQLGVTLDQLVADGYDGVCLQGVGDYARDAKSRPTSAANMAAFVEALAARARKSDPAFSVLPDGGAALPGLLPAAASKTYLATVDGILARDVFYPGDKPADNELLPDEKLIAALDAFQKAGEPVFVTERLTDPAKIVDFLTRARAKGYVADAALAPPAAPPSPAPPATPVSAKVADAVGR